MIHLHMHSHYSLLDGMSSPKEIVEKVKKIGAKHFSITDHGNISAFAETYKLAKENGLNYIPGCEFYFVDENDPMFGKRGEKRYHFIALAKNWKGLQTIFRKVTLSNQQKFNGYPRLFLSQLFDFENCLISGACSSGYMQRDDYRDITQKFMNTYGDDFYLEILPISYNMYIKDLTKPPFDNVNLIKWQIEVQTQHMSNNKTIQKDFVTDGIYEKTIDIDGGALVNQRVIEMHKDYGVQIALTQDSHFTNKDDAAAFEIILCIQTKNKISRPREDRFFFGDDEIYIKDMREMVESTRKLGYVSDDIIKTAVLNTEVIAKKCNIEMPEFSFNFPSPYPEEDDVTVFKRKLKEGWNRLGLVEKENVKEYVERLNEEVNTIMELSLVRYFLIVEDIMRFCREKGIGTGPGRGCYTKDAMVWTTDGYKEISNVKTGDKVINEDGEIDTVVNTFKYDVDENIYEIDYKYGSNTFGNKRCTGDHKQLIYDGSKTVWKKTEDILLTDKMCIPKLKPLNKKIPTIDLNDYNVFGYEFDDEFIYEKVATNCRYKYSMNEVHNEIGLSRNAIKEYLYGNNSKKETIYKIEAFTNMNKKEYVKYIEDKHFITKKIKRFIDVDSDFNKLIGLLIGDGWIGKNDLCVGLAINNSTEKDKWNRNIFNKFYNKMFQDRSFYYENKSKTKKLTQLYINSKIISHFFKSEVILYNNEGFKNINRKWIEQDKTNIKSLMMGMVYSDGHFDKNENRISFDNSSISVISAFCEILMRLSKIPTIITRQPYYHGKYLCKKSYKVRFSKNSEKTEGNDKYYFTDINSIKNLGCKKTSVYDLSIKNKQSFMINNYITHNSGGGSLVCLLLGITKVIDPIEHKLYFERFLNKSRVSMADLDCDFESNRRHEILEYLKDKYGRDKVVQIATYGYLSPKSAFRDVASVYSVSSKEINKLSKLIEPGVIKEDGQVIETYDAADSFDHVPELIEFKKRYPVIIEVALKLDGRVRNASTHAAGIITSSIPITDLGAIESRKGGECVCWDKNVSEEVFKLLKLDCLGLKTIDVNEGTIRLIEDHGGPLLDSEKLPLDDPKAIDEFSKGKSTTIFQFEGSNATRLLKEGENGTLESIAAVSSVNRPGPLNAKDEDGVNITTRFVECLSGRRTPNYILDDLKGILGETHGEQIYQEQTMEIAREIAGFTMAEADNLRKVIGKKLGKEGLLKHKKSFVDGCVKNNYDEKISSAIFDQILEFSAYQFNKAHAIAYGIISMQSMYLKVNYPLEYFCSCLTYVGKDEVVAKYITDAKRFGIEVVYPDINDSHPTKFTISDKKIVAPLNSIKGVGDVASLKIEEAREKTGYFTSYSHFEETIAEMKFGSKVNKRVKECLFKGNCFKKLGYFIEDPEEEENNLRALLSLFSPIPSFKPKNGRVHEKVELSNLLTEVESCGYETYGDLYNNVKPISFAKPSIMVVCGLSQWDSALLQKENTSWIQSHLMNELGIPRADMYFTSAVKCGFKGVAPNKIPKECTNKCRDFLEREIKIIRPRLIINCVSGLFQWLVGDNKAKFMDSFGQVFYSGDFESYVVPCPSPQWVSFQDDAREHFNNSIVPLLKKMYRSEGEE